MTRKPRQLTPRICVHCGVDHGIHGPRPYGSTLKLVGDEIVYVCRDCPKERPTPASER